MRRLYEASEREEQHPLRQLSPVPSYKLQLWTVLRPVKTDRELSARGTDLLLPVTFHLRNGRVISKLKAL